jgi:predicted RNA methylase
VAPFRCTLRDHPTMTSGGHEPDGTRLLRELLRNIDVFVNIGANIGYYCFHAFELGKTVIAIEQVARNACYLLANIDDNGWGNRTEVLPVALCI